MPDASRYDWPIAITEGIQAAMGEWQKGREKKKQEAMMRIMLGTGTPEDEKLLKMKVPRPITEVGKAEREEEKYTETLEHREEMERLRRGEQAEERKRKEREAAEKREDAMWDFAVTLNTDPFTKETDWDKVPITIQKMKEARKAKPKPKPTAGARLEGLGLGKIAPPKVKPGIAKRSYTPKEFSKSKVVEALLESAEQGNEEAYKTLKKMRSLGMLK